MMETEPLPVSCLALLEARSAGGHTEPSLCLQPTVAGGGGRWWQRWDQTQPAPGRLGHDPQGGDSAKPCLDGALLEEL